MTGVMSCRLVVALALFSFSAAQSIAKVKYEWTLPEFDWDNATQKADFESTGRYVPDNCVVSGVKYYKGVTYVTVPRWRLGIPSTLNSVVEVNGSALLRPYPSWEMNKVDDCSALQYVQSMEITPAGVMWILDVGRRNFQATAINKCPPKIILWNMNTDSEIRRTVFPDAVAPYTSSFLNDIVVDLVHNYGYIADAAGEGAIIAYSAESGLARRFVGPSTGVEADARIATINGVNYTIGAAADSIALSPDAETLYYAALAGYTLFGLATEHLRNFDLTNAQQVVANDTDMVWIDTFGFGAPGKLLFTTNTLMWFVPPRNPAWGKPPLKIRVWEVDLGNNIQSYLVPQEAMVGSSSDEESSSSSGDAPLTTDEWGGVVIAAFIMGALVAGVVCLVMVRRRKKAQANLELF